MGEVLKDREEITNLFRSLEGEEYNYAYDFVKSVESYFIKNDFITEKQYRALRNILSKPSKFKEKE